MEKQDVQSNKVNIEEAIERVGFGLYSILLTVLAGITVIAFACVGYANTILVPTSACELQTSSAQQGILAAGPVIGSVIGAMIWGYLADTRGRRIMLLISTAVAATVNTIASISVNWVMLMALQFIGSFFASGLYSMSVSLLSESVPLLKRNIVVLVVSSISLLSQGIMAVLAIPVIPLNFSVYVPALGIYWNSWRLLVVIYSLPCVIAGIAYIFVRESPKYHYSKGNLEEALKTLRIIHKVNHFRTNEVYNVEALLEEETEGTPGAKKSQITPLFKLPLVKYTIIMTTLTMFQQISAFLIWLPTITDHIVQVIGEGNGADLPICSLLRLDILTLPDANATPCALNVTALLIILGIGAAQSFFNVLLSLIVNRVGRRNIVLVVTAVCGICGILVNLVPNYIASMVLFGIMLLGIVTIGLYIAIIVALFPTHLRAFALAFALTGGRLATFAAIQILNALLENNCEAGFYLFGSLFAASAIVASFLPDDRYIRPIDSEDSSNQRHRHRRGRTNSEFIERPKPRQGRVKKGGDETLEGNN